MPKEGMIRNRIKEFCLERGIKSGSEFSRITNIPTSSAFRLWNKESLPSQKTIKKICEVFNCKVSDFLDFGDS
jgi:DNA-binding Xre family transcriptional regulator